VSGPATTLDERFSDATATAVPWDEGRQHLVDAEVYWIATVRPDGQPHVTPLLAVWVDEALWFCTGPDERKARNLEADPHVTFVTGCNLYSGGLDVVVEGEAVRETDEAMLLRLRDAWVDKYGSDWSFDVRDGAFAHSDGAGVAHVFRVRASTVFGFGKGGPFSQTRWRF
jgi:pyridoxine/pyridoxamine 5'-phosphate oxidase